VSGSRRLVLLALLAGGPAASGALAATTEPDAAAAPDAAPAATAAPSPGSYVWQLPRGFPTPAVPADNPMSAAKVALGRRLFFEPRLSVTGRHSCSSCHDPTLSFSDGKARATGALGDTLPRGAMALVNVAYNISFGWTQPGVRSLEAQMRQPLFNTHPVELGLASRGDAVATELATDPGYAPAFAAAFPATEAPVTMDHAIQAIAAFERTLISGDSPFDRYVFQGDHAALSESAKRGMALFFARQAGCSACHSGFNFTGTWRDDQGDTGKPAFANNGTSTQPMRVPTLRNIALTAPYMHDGRFPTLEAVLDHYFSLGDRASRYDARLPRTALDGQQRADLIAFLNSLTDESFVRRCAD
jgi:cytochrome c peroxidase